MKQDNMLGGTPTFLAIDIDESDFVFTRDNKTVRETMDAYRRLVEAGAKRNRGVEIEELRFKARYVFGFCHATNAFKAAFELQQEFINNEAMQRIPVNLCMGLCTGEVAGNAVLANHRLPRRAYELQAMARGQQILMLLATQDIIRDSLDNNFGFQDLGTHEINGSMRAERIFQPTHPDLPREFAPIAPSKAQHNIPPRLTFFIGREEERADAREALDSSRMLTITGTGGVGKTSFVQCLALELLGGYPDGIWWFDLTTIGPGGNIFQVIADTLKIRQVPGYNIDQSVLQYLHDKDMMLVLDNCDHVGDSAEEGAEELLRCCPQVQIVATTRRPLDIAGEVVLPLPSLNLPPNANLAVDKLMEFDGIALFMDRVFSISRKLKLTEDNAQAVVTICNALDGIPLALELAASKTLTMSLDEILAALEDRFAFLKEDGHHTESRHPTMYDVVQWSYAQLSEPARLLFNRLSVFRGGWSLEAAQTVCADDQLSAADIQAALIELLRNSLVIRRSPESVNTRFAFLNTIRLFAEDKLKATEDAQRVRRAHCDWYMALTEEVAGELDGEKQREWLDTLDSDRENLRAAVDCLLHSEDHPSRALKFLVDCFSLWLKRSWLSDALQFTKDLIRRIPDKDHLDLAQANNIAGNIEQRRGNIHVSRDYLKESLRISTLHNSQRGIAVAYANLALNSRDLRDTQTALIEFEESISRWRRLNEPDRLVSVMCGYAGVLSAKGRVAEARLVLDEAEEISRDFPEQDRYQLGIFVFARGEIALAEARFEEAAICFLECAQRSNDLRSLHHVASAFRMVIVTRCNLGQFEKAALLIGAEELIRENLESKPAPDRIEAFEDAVRRCENALGDEQFVELRAQGRALSLSEALEAAE